MQFSKYLSPLRNVATTAFGGSLLRWIEIALVGAIITFVGFLWVSRGQALEERDTAVKANLVSQQQLLTITQDLKEVKAKQQLAVEDRDRISKQTQTTLSLLTKQKLPKDCKAVVKWAADNQLDTKW